MDELVKADKTEMQVANHGSTSTLNRIIDLIEGGADVDTALIEKMMDLSDRQDDKKNLSAFNVAMAAFKENPPTIIKDKHNKQYDSKYSSLANVTATISRALSEHGLSASWETDQKEGMIYVTCLLAHRLGHSKKTTLFAPPDVSGKKNPIQQIKSTISYLQQITLLSAVGLATDDKNDDDGNGAYSQTPAVRKATVPEARAIELICRELPDKDGFMPNLDIITAICLDKCRDHLTPDFSNKIADYLVKHHEGELYMRETGGDDNEAINENEQPGCFGQE